jgi:hypothetical protein
MNKKATIAMFVITSIVAASDLMHIIAVSVVGTVAIYCQYRLDLRDRLNGKS